jgi:glycosyltransferase involved in cell wall biosynthesis
MKGADRLLDVARELKRLGIQFEMFICGDGDLKEKMQREIVATRLSDRVKMMGVLDFKTELIPFAKANVDLFVCCHPQGDPSCTYLETMSCGVPIVGYANEAFEGVVKYSQAGWLIPMDRPKLMAQQVADLSHNRHSIQAMSLKALEFARQHTFEKTWEARISHLKRVAMRKIALESSMLH